MRRWLAVPVVVLLALAACGNKDDAEGADEEPVVTDDVATAVEIARLSLPATLDEDTVADLIEDLCSAAGTGNVDSVVAQLMGTTVDPAQLGSSVDALAAGAGTYCPDDVDDVVPQVQQALAPATTTSAPSAAAAGAGGTGGTSRSSASASSGGGSSTGGASTQSAGSASVGGGNATGTGNQSSTDYSQGVTSSNGSSGGSSAGSSTTG